VLVSRRKIFVPGEGIAVFQDRALHPRVSLRHWSLTGVTADSSLVVGPLGRGFVATRSGATLVLEGQGRVHMDGREIAIRAGDLVLTTHVRSLRERGEAGIRFVELDWDSAWLGGGVSQFECLHTGLAASVRRSLALLDEGPRGAATLAAKVFDGLRAEGVPLPAVAAENLECPESTRFAEVSAAMDRTLSLVGEKPCTVDLEESLSCTRRHVTRLVEAFNDAFGLEGLRGTSWRATRDYWRLFVGVLLMSSANARTAPVAKVLGYASAEAFCRAFANAGLPSPARVREVVHAGA
jgi:AraC-like DNA-binding protein